MDIYSIVILVGFVIALLLGFLMGFGRVLRFITGGIVGIVCSIIFCAIFGGIIANIPFVADLIVRGNEYFGQYAAILKTLSIATWIYYVILFLIVQVVRIILVRTVANIFTPKNKDSKVYGIRKLINRILGFFVMGAAYVLLVYFVLALIALFEDVASVNNFITELGNAERHGLFYLLYEHNPIDLYVLFKK